LKGRITVPKRRPAGAGGDACLNGGIKNGTRMRKKKQELTIEMIEEKSGVKLTYPNQFVPGSIDEEKYKELTELGCSDVWDEKGVWLHRDCFSRNCKKCVYYPIVERYNKENNIPGNIETDFVKGNVILDFLKIFKNEKKDENC
jgi:hypothetical protein